MNVLVTGANGFLGSWICKRFLQEGFHVHALVRAHSDLSELESLKVDLAFGDITDLGSLMASFRKMDVVIHAAGLVGYSSALRKQMEKVNVAGTANVIEACKKSSVHRLVHISSVVTVGAGFSKNEILDENSAFNLSHLDLGYFETKRSAEKLIIEAVSNQDLDAVIVNPSTMYGPGDAKKSSRKNQIKVAQGKLKFFTDGGVNVISVEDAVEGILSAMKVGRAGERYILGSENLTIETLFEQISSFASVQKPSIRLPTWLIRSLGYAGEATLALGLKFPFNKDSAYAATLFHWFKNEKAVKQLNLNPRPASYAIEQSVRWMRDNGLLKR